VAKHVANIRQIEAELAEIQKAESILQAKPNGKANGKMPEILQSLPITQRDRVLAAVRSRRVSGSTRQLIIHKLDQQDLDISANNVSTYLNQLLRQGLVRHVRGLWFPT
jgi:hypothetical protein